MNVLTWICLAINIIVALFLAATLLNPNQDAAGKGMIFLPVILLLVCAGSAWLLMSRNYRVAAFLISAVPAVIAVYVLFLTVRKS